jgi:hypothetical protein
MHVLGSETADHGGGVVCRVLGGEVICAGCRYIFSSRRGTVRYHCCCG